MKTAPNNSALDIFLRETLKSADEKMQPFDWSELEVLLKHEQRTIPVEVNKKTILITGAAVIIVLLSFGIFKIAHYYSSLPAETETLIDSTQNSFILIDSLTSPVTDSIPLKTDTLKKDTANYLSPKIDSAASFVATDTTRTKKEIVPPLKIKSNPDKKKKTDSTLNQLLTDTAINKKELPAPVKDTASGAPSKENNIVIPSIPDTVVKKSATENKISKKKKDKTKKEFPSPAANGTEIPLAKPDSSKQR